jgi:phosphoribosyl-AMP cyclohydrolase / phosphoribosyl-ATP pyrophosphohydrolase
MIDPDTIDFEKGNGLIPVVVQDASTLQVLTLAYMDRAALDETIESGEATFFSRSRGGRWRKGETSGDRLHVVGMTADCDSDALVLSVNPVGDACHLHRTSCFGAADAPGLGRIARLERTHSRTRRRRSVGKLDRQTDRRRPQTDRPEGRRRRRRDRPRRGRRP